MSSVDKSDTQDTLLLKIDAPKIVDLIMTKQTQLYGLWAVYTAVEFTAGSFGMGKPVPLGVAIAVWFGVWAFNFGHLGFVLQCLTELKVMRAALKAAVTNDKGAYQETLISAVNQIDEGCFFLFYYFKDDARKTYGMASFVHFFIDACASVALLIRVGNPWVQAHVPEFLRGVGL